MKTATIAMAAILLGFVPGCGTEPRFDATNEATIKASTRAVLDRLDPRDQKTVLAKILRKTIRGTRDPGAGPRSIHGLTGPEILSVRD